ncbi:MAG: hypothetical protein HUJ11_03415 [Arenibacter algicola]|nr:hypothetical protein [Arenibacter algicola]
MFEFSSWSVLTTNFLIILYLALGGAVFPVLLHLAGARRWRAQVGFLAGTTTALFPIAFVLLLILLANGEMTFPWLKEANETDQNLSGWHNYKFLVARELIGFAIVAGLSVAAIRCQYLAEADPAAHSPERFNRLAILMPFAYVIYGTMVAWDFEMTLEPGWHSASYGAYQFQSAFHGFLGFFAMMLYFLDRSGRLTRPFEPKIYNYMAQFILAMSIMWVYFYFTQYLVMWYGRLPHDMERYWRMIDEGYMLIGVVFLVLKFVLPFCVFLFKRNRHNPATIMTMGFCVILGTWIERYVWVTGSVPSVQYHIPLSSAFDVAVTAGLMGLSWLAVGWALMNWWLIRHES